MHSRRAVLLTRPAQIGGLVGRWRLNEPALSWADQTGEVKDSSGYFHHGTGVGYSGTQSPVSSARGNVGSFDGSTESVTIGNIPSLNFGSTSAFSITAWLHAATAYNYARIVSKAAGSFPGWWLELSSNAPVFYASDASHNVLGVASSQSVVDSTWHFVAMVYTGTGRASGVSLYVDGTLQSPSVLYDALVDTFASTEPFVIGSDGGGGARFTGLLSDVRAYATALTGAEIQLLFHGA
jgi:hypothetical protein